MFANDRVALGRYARLFAVVTALTVVTVLTGCSELTASVGLKVGSDLKHETHNSKAELDFGKVIPGGWTRIAIICGPVPLSSVDQSLGFAWSPPGGKLLVNDSVILFVNGHSVVTRYVEGVDDSTEDEYFTPCFPPDYPNGSGSKIERQVVMVPRNRSTIQLALDRSANVWFIDSKERLRLAAIER